jgi:tetratricopeptide (TPR) repeat protein
MLSNLDPTCGKYRFGLASSYHKNKRYEEAAAQYFATAMIDQLNPLPHFHAADCFLQMNEKESAIFALEGAISRSKNDLQFEKMRERAIAMQQRLKEETNWDARLKKLQQEAKAMEAKG